MSRVVKSRNLFLEKEELVRTDRFVSEDGYRDFLKRILASGGVTTTAEGTMENNFLFVEGSTHTRIKLLEDAYAYDGNGDRIHIPYQVNQEWLLPFDPGAAKDIWVYCEFAETSIEIGTVTLNANGELIGLNTKFTEVFRGQASLVPNKVAIYERAEVDTGGTGYSYNLVGSYEVNEVVDDLNVFVNAANALPAGTYVYAVHGAFSPGTYDDSRAENIYAYDSANIQFSDLDPTNTLTENQFMLCKVNVNDLTGVQEITDLRDPWTINLFGAVLLKTNQTVNGIKSFTSPPRVPTPLNNDDAVPKKWIEDYIESEISGIPTPEEPVFEELTVNGAFGSIQIDCDGIDHVIVNATSDVEIEPLNVSDFGVVKFTIAKPVGNVVSWTGITGSLDGLMVGAATLNYDLWKAGSRILAIQKNRQWDGIVEANELIALNGTIDTVTYFDYRINDNVMTFNAHITFTASGTGKEFKMFMNTNRKLGTFLRQNVSLDISASGDIDAPQPVHAYMEDNGSGYEFSILKHDHTDISNATHYVRLSGHIIIK